MCIKCSTYDCLENRNAEAVYMEFQDDYGEYYFSLCKTPELLEKFVKTEKQKGDLFKYVEDLSDINWELLWWAINKEMYYTHGE